MKSWAKPKGRSEVGQEFLTITEEIDQPLKQPYLWVDVNCFAFLKLLLLGLRVVEEKPIFQNEEPSKVKKFGTAFEEDNDTCDHLSLKSSKLKGIVSSSFMQHFISQQTTANLWFFSTSGTSSALNYINLTHQVRRITTVAQLHVCRHVLLDVRGIVRVLEVFVQLLGLKLAL